MRAYHAFIQTAVVAQGLLQYLGKEGLASVTVHDHRILQSVTARKA
jgi:hypothetical protein